MKKIGLSLLFLLAINFASAVELGELIGTLDQSLVISIALFLVTFSLAFFSLGKIFKENKNLSGVIAVTVAFLAVYGINKIEFDTSNFFYNLGISESAFSLMLFILITAGIIYMFMKFKKNSLLILGALFIGLSFFVYTKALLIVIGIILIVIRFFIPKGKWNRKRGQQGNSVTSTH